MLIFIDWPALIFVANALPHIGHAQMRTEIQAGRSLKSWRHQIANTDHVKLPSVSFASGAIFMPPPKYRAFAMQRFATVIFRIESSSSER